MKVIKGASGFGDSIYTRVVVEWLVKHRPDDYLVLTKYPEVFTGLPVKLDDFFKPIEVDYRCTYVSLKSAKGTQWQNILTTANLPFFPFTSDLKQDIPLKHTLVISPYDPMNGVKTSLPMKPLIQEFYDFISNYSPVYFINKKFPFLELVKLFNESKLIITQIGWAIALAEMLDKPLIAIFTKRALNNDNKFISTITPEKIVTKPTTQVKIME